MTIRLATAADAEVLIGFDHLASEGSARRAFIRRSIDAGRCFVALSGAHGPPVAYGVLEYTFYDNGFVAMLYVAAPHRGRGFGGALLRHLESRCRTPKLFTSTNQSNMPMQRLLHKHPYTPSGVIENLDEGDPELVFFKQIPMKEPQRHGGTEASLYVRASH